MVVVVLLESGTGLDRTSIAVVAGILGSGNGLDTVVVGICRSSAPDLDLVRATGSPTFGLGTTSGTPDTSGIRDD